jgi:hypothetical protein
LQGKIHGTFGAVLVGSVQSPLVSGLVEKLLDGSKLPVRIGCKAVEGDEDRKMVEGDIGKMLEEVLRSFLGGLHVFLAEIFELHSAVELEGADRSDHDDEGRMEGAERRDDIEVFLHSEVAAESSFRNDIVAELQSKVR